MLSIIIPKYRDFAGLRTSLLYIERQKYKCEIVIKDATECHLTKQFLKQNNFDFALIKYVSSDDIGIYDAINQAAKYCTGSHIWVIGCGDLPHLGVFSELELEPGFTYAAPVLLKDGSILTEYTGRFTPSHQGLIYCRGAYQGKKYNPNYKIISDRIFYDEYLSKHPKNIRKIKVPICTFLLTGISSDPKSRKIIMTEMLAYFFEVPSIKNFMRVLSAVRNYLAK